MKPSKPKIAKVGHWRIPITWSSGSALLGDEEHQCQGIYFKAGEEIVIYSKLSKSEMAETLWHEIKHAIHDFYGISDDVLRQSKEEEYVDYSGKMEITFMMDNPKLMVWLLSQLK